MALKVRSGVRRSRSCPSLIPKKENTGRNMTGIFFGGDDGIQTHDLLYAIQAL
jgi:hypothetical protein